MTYTREDTRRTVAVKTEAAGDLTLSGNNVNTVMEISGTNRGVTGGYDAIDVGASKLLTYDGTLTLTMTALIADGTYDLFNFTSTFDAGGFGCVAGLVGGLLGALG